MRRRARGASEVFQPRLATFWSHGENTQSFVFIAESRCSSALTRAGCCTRLRVSGEGGISASKDRDSFICPSLSDLSSLPLESWGLRYLLSHWDLPTPPPSLAASAGSPPGVTKVSGLRDQLAILGVAQHDGQFHLNFNFFPTVFPPEQ